MATRGRRTKYDADFHPKQALKYSLLGLTDVQMAGAFGGAIISWALYQGQWQSLNDISMFLDNGNFTNGMAIYQNISLNALMASSKIVLGSTCWLTVPILIFVLTHHYGQFNYRRVVLFRKIIKGDSVKGYRFT